MRRAGRSSEEQALISVLKNKQIAGAAIDVFDIEPPPLSHPSDAGQRTGNAAYRLRIACLYKTFYEDTVSNIRKWSTNNGREWLKGDESWETKALCSSRAESMKTKSIGRTSFLETSHPRRSCGK